MAKPVQPDPELTARVRELVVASSTSDVGRLLGIADATVARLAGGLPVHKGTILLVVQRLAEPKAA